MANSTAMAVHADAATRSGVKRHLYFLRHQIGGGEVTLDHIVGMEPLARMRSTKHGKFAWASQEWEIYNFSPQKMEVLMGRS